MRIQERCTHDLRRDYEEIEGAVLLKARKGARRSREKWIEQTSEEESEGLLVRLDADGQCHKTLSFFFRRGKENPRVLLPI